MVFQQADLFLKFLRAGPVIIAFQPGDILPTTGPANYLLICIDPKVTFVQVQANDVWVLIPICLDDLPGFVRGAILADHEFVIKVGLLHQYAIDTLSDVGRVIIGQHMYANHRLFAFSRYDSHLVAKTELDIVA